MDLDQPEHVLSSYTTPLGSPSYSPPLEEHSKEERDDNDDEDEDEETEEDRAARRKAKGKAKASPPPEEHDSDDEHQMESPRVGSLNPATLDPIAEEDTDTDTEMDMDSYWARQAREAYEIAARADMSGYGHEKQFGEADAAMNDALYSHPSSPTLSPTDDNDKENQKTGPGAPNNSPERGTPGASDHATITRTFAELQQQQLGGGGRGRGRGRGSGGGWAWQETMTQEKVEKEGWGAYDTPPSSPLAEQQVLEESAWEAYDEAAWEAAAERAAKQETPKVTLKLPHSTLSVKPSSVKEKGEGSATHKVGPEQSGELVRAVRSYKAIFSGTYLSYEKDDVMRVLHRDKDGSLIGLLGEYSGASC